jgi:hypothetical protein
MMTAFAQLEKTARINPAAVWNALKGFGKGFARAPGDAVAAASGLGRGEVFSNLAARSKELQGAAQNIGNLTGQLGLTGSGLFALDQAINGKDARDGAQSTRSKGVAKSTQSKGHFDAVHPDAESWRSRLLGTTPRDVIEGAQNLGGDLMGREKAAATEISDPVRDEKDKKDAAALRNRHILLALKRALQGGAAGAVVGGIGAAGEPGGLSGGHGALLGLLGGGAAGLAGGAAEGGLKRSIGLDPLLQTIATARRP